MYLLIVLFLSNSWAAFSNYNSVIIGEKAAGMGGVGTALLGDPSASSFYNPATLSRMPGKSLSASTNIYNKIDTKYGQVDSGIQAAEKINQGSFKSIPSASGSIASYGQFAMGLSIIVPDYDYYAGFLKNTTDTKTSLQILDESLWVGGNFSVNTDDKQSLGITMYYTSRFYQRTLQNEKLTTGPAGAFIKSESVSHTHNSLVYILGYYNQISDKIGIGMSLRFPSIEISGIGQVYVSELQTPAQAQPVSTSGEDLKAETRVPVKGAIGFTYTPNKKKTFSLDVSYFGEEKYRDIEDDTVATQIHNQSVVNFNLGYEAIVNKWLRWRLGAFTNFSSSTPIKAATERRSDHIDMWGFSTNFAVFTDDQVAFVLGGYYTGGRGHDVQQIGQTYEVLDKSKQIFSMLVGSAYFF